MGGGEYVLALVVVAVGATLQGSLGFGMNLLAAPVLVLLEPAVVPVPLLMLAATLSALVATRERRAVALGELGWAFAGRIPGALVGATAVALAPRRAIAVALGVLVLCAAAASAAGAHVQVRRRSLVVAGGISGAMGTATSVGGPPMALLYQRGAGPVVRGRLASFFLLGTLSSLGILALAGEVDAARLRLGATLVPAVVVGFVVSRWTRGHLDGERLRPAVLAVSALAAGSLIVRTLLEA